MLTMKRKLGAKSKSQNHSSWQAQHYAEFKPYCRFFPVTYVITHTQRTLLFFAIVCLKGISI